MRDTYFETPPTDKHQLWHDELGHLIATVEPRGVGVWGVTCPGDPTVYHLVSQKTGGYVSHTEKGQSTATAWPAMIRALIERRVIDQG